MHQPYYLTTNIFHYKTQNTQTTKQRLFRETSLPLLLLLLLLLLLKNERRKQG